MARKKKRDTRLTSHYLKLAREISAVAPGMKKLARKKRLTGAEKAAITRTAKAVARAGGISSLLPVTAKQAKKLRKTKSLIGGGIRAIPRNNFGNAKSIRITKTGYNIVEKLPNRRERIWHVVPVDPADVDRIPEIMREIFERENAKGNRIQINLMTMRGRGSVGIADKNLVNRLILQPGTLEKMRDLQRPPIVGLVWTVIGKLST